MGLDEGRDRHAGNKLETAESIDITLRDGDTNRVETGAGFLIFTHVRRNSADFAIELRRRALILGYDLKGDQQAHR
jgi:hypothetical protein